MQLNCITQQVKVICEERFFWRDRRKEKSKSRPVSRVLSWTVIHLGLPSLTTSSNLPESSAGHANGFLFGLAPDGVCLATDCYQPCGALLPHLFTLTGACALRRSFSVALSVGLRLPGVTWRLALRSPDFPPSSRLATGRQRLSGQLLPAKSTTLPANMQLFMSHMQTHQHALWIQQNPPVTPHTLAPAGSCRHTVG